MGEFGSGRVTAKLPTKVEFVACLNRRGKPRNRKPVSVAWLNDLIKDGLIDKLRRIGNNGKSPVYMATLAHYKQAICINRLQTIGIQSRDALLVQLFVRGKDLSAPLVREALRREFIRALKKLRSLMRSGYFENSKDVPPGHMSSLSKLMGELDYRLSELAQPNAFYLETTRVALASRLGNSPNPFAGLLLWDSETEALSDELEVAFRAPPSTFCAVRNQFKVIDQKMFRRLVGRDVLNSPDLVAFGLTIGLVMRSRGFSVESLLSMIPKVEGFSRLVREFPNGEDRGA